MTETFELFETFQQVVLLGYISTGHNYAENARVVCFVGPGDAAKSVKLQLLSGMALRTTEPRTIFLDHSKETPVKTTEFRVKIGRSTQIAYLMESHSFCKYGFHVNAQNFEDAVFSHVIENAIIKYATQKRNVHLGVMEDVEPRQYVPVHPSWRAKILEKLFETELIRRFTNCRLDAVITTSEGIKIGQTIQEMIRNGELEWQE